MNHFEISVNAMNFTLYQLDPARTSCKENGLRDEYDNASIAIIEDNEFNEVSLVDSIANNLEFYYLIEKDEYDVNKIAEMYNEYLILGTNV